MSAPPRRSISDVRLARCMSYGRLTRNGSRAGDALTPHTPGGSAKPAPGTTTGLADQRAGHAGDLVCGSTGSSRLAVAGVLCHPRDCEETLASTATATHRNFTFRSPDRRLPSFRSIAENRLLDASRA
jgi:hypothetical protein